jgi:hypothetical protein
VVVHVTYVTIATVQMLHKLLQVGHLKCVSQRML